MNDNPAPPAAAGQAAHPALAAWKADSGGALLVGGTSVSALAARLGQTPYYAYDRTKIAARIAELRAALPQTIRLHYAIKANPMPAVVDFVSGLVDGVDVASARELDVALDAGVIPERIGFAGPAKTDAELARAAAAGIIVEIESEGELRRLVAAGERTGCRPRAAVRVNPDFKMKGSGMHMGGGPSQFGVDAEQVPDLLQKIGDSDLAFYGFHIFGGSQNLDPDSILAAEREIADCAIRLAGHAPAPVRHLNIGGGFGIPYFPRDKPLDLRRVGAGLADIVAEIEGALPQAEVVVELGRYIVGEAGIYVCKVIDRKVSRGRTFLVTDGGLHHHLAATGNFGQAIRRNYPVALATRFLAPATEEVSVVGCLCTPIDLLADKVGLPTAEVGDLVAIFQSGAYGATASPQGFLSHPGCKETLV